MSGYDTATWTCPKCDEVVESERVVDETFITRVNAHKAEHFKCAIEEANRTGAKRCKARCPSCRIWWPDVRPDE